MRSVLLAIAIPALSASPCAQTLLDHAVLERHLPPVRARTRAAAFVDVDADGALDLVFAAQGRDRLLLGDGRGRFRETDRQWPALEDLTSAIGSGDFDGDGDVDLVLGRDDAPDRLLLNDGNGGFTDAPSPLPSGISGTDHVVAADLDADGDLDLVLCGSPTILLLNDGTGRFVNATSSNLPPRTATGSNAGLALDVDGDGDLDLVVGGSARGSLMLLVNDGAAVFTDGTASRMPPAPDRARSLAAGDIDGDGRTDLLVGVPGLQAELLLGNGVGGFGNAPAGQVPPAPGDLRAIALSDLDGDGDLDALAVGGLVTAPLGLLAWRNESGLLVDVSATWAPWFESVTYGLAVGDVDGDDAPDAVLGIHGGWEPELDALLLNDGTGRLVSASSPALPLTFGTTVAAAAADLDADGATDLVFADVPASGTGASQTVTVFLGTGNEARFVPASSLPGSVDPVRAIALSDLDLDGDADIVVGGTGSPDRIWINDGSGRFNDETWLRAPGLTAATWSLEIGDVDGDGDPDLLVGKANPVLPIGAADQLWLNDGRGYFQDASHMLPRISIVTRALCLGDVDGDGDLDLFAGNGALSGSDRRDRLYRNDGGGRFSDATAGALPAAAASSYTARFADVDRDGDLDLYLGGANGHRVLLGNGSGAFAVGAGLPGLVGTVSSVAVADLDEDGHPDLIAGLTGGSTPTLRAFRNLGGARFADATARWVPAELGRTFGLWCGDLDADGDADLVIASGGSLLGGANRVLANRVRQMVTPFLPSRGGGLTVELSARPGEAGLFHVAVPLLSPRRARIEVVPFGVVQIELATSIQLPPAYVPPGTGFTSFEVPVPTDPALAGARVYAQAVFLHPTRGARLGPATADTIR